MKAITVFATLILSSCHSTEWQRQNFYPASVRQELNFEYEARMWYLRCGRAAGLSPDVVSGIEEYIANQHGVTVRK